MTPEQQATTLLEKKIRSEMNHPELSDEAFEKWAKTIRPTKQYANDLKMLVEFGKIRFEEGKKATRHSLQYLIDSMPPTYRRSFSHPLYRLFKKAEKLGCEIIDDVNQDEAPGALLDYAYMLANLLDSFRRRHPNLDAEDLVRATHNRIQNGGFAK